MSDYETIKKKRMETDYIMPMWLPFLPIIVSIISGIVALLGVLFLFPSTVNTVTSSGTTATQVISPLSTMGIFSLLFLPSMIITYIFDVAAGVIIGYVVYRLVKRFNDHVYRIKALFSSVNQDGRENSVLNEINMLPKRDSTMWGIIVAIMYVIPFLSVIGLILILYIFHSLNKDFLRLERAENNGFIQLGWRGERYFTMSDRSTILYIVLTIITLGLFGIYWVYTVAKDPNNHFKEDWRIEDSITPPASGMATINMPPTAPTNQGATL